MFCISLPISIILTTDIIMKRFLTALAAVSLLMLSCEEETEVAEIDIPAASAEVFSKGLEVDAAESSTRLSFSTTQPWKASVQITKAASWINIFPESGEAGDANLTVTTTPNTSESDRSATVTIQSGDVTKSFTVTQAGYVPPTVEVTSVSLSERELTLEVGQTAFLIASVLPDDATDKTVTWTSADTKVASVTGGNVPDVTGVPMPGATVTAVAEGETTINAKAGDVVASCKVTVKKKDDGGNGNGGEGGGEVTVTGITLDNGEIHLTPSQTFQLVATVQPEDAASQVTVSWSSKNTGVATVDQNGTVTAVANGETDVVASAGGKEASCHVKVESEVAITGISLNETALTLKEGETFQLQATFIPATATPKTIEWTSSIPAVATVDDNGLVTAVRKGGPASIWAIVNKGTYLETSVKCEVTVTGDAPAIESITVTPAKVTVNATESTILTATVNPEGTGAVIQWTSDNTAIATVEKISDTQAQVTGVGIGNVKVIASVGDVFDYSEVTVEKKGSGGGETGDVSIALDKTTLQLGFYETAQLTATVTPAGAAADMTVTWTSSNEEVVIVSNGSTSGADGSIMPAGMVMAKNKEGEATITAKAGDKAATCKVVVKDNTVAVTSVELNKTSIELAEGATEQLTATVKPDNATNKTVTWSTSNSTYVTVDNTGKVTAVKSGEATITATASGKTADCKVTVTVEEVVDLGLSVKWRAWNVGATKPIEYGDYFAWGETEVYYTGLSYGNNSGLDANGWKSGKSYGYNWRSNKYRTSGFYAYEEGTNHLIVSKYNTQEGNGRVDNKTVLDAEDDPASVILGGGWRTPTNVEWQELLDNCTIEYIKAYDFLYKEGSNPGFAASAMKFTSRKNGKSIIIPLAGRFMNEYLYSWNAYYGFYWSSSMPTSYTPEGGDGKEWAPAVAWMCYMKNTEAQLSCYNRCNGMTVRPVKN